MNKIYTSISMLFIFAIATNAQNLIVNGDFQTWIDNNPVAWSSELGTIITPESSIVHSQDSSMNIELITTSQDQTDFRQSINVLNGHKYNVSVWVYHLDTLSNISIYAGGFTYTYSKLHINNIWQEITYEYTATADIAVEFGLRFYDKQGFDANINHSFMYIDDFSVVDATVSGTAPIIENTLTIPAIPTYSDNVNIQADITDDGTITTAYVLYNTDESSTFNDSIEMLVSSAPTYLSNAQIPAQTEGTTVQYFIRAKDNNNEIRKSQIYSYTISMEVDTGDCENLFFSEYIEGTSNNKALEIYNPTDASIDLSNYSIQRFNNGNTTANSTFHLVGTIDAGDVYVLVNHSAVSSFTDLADTLTSFVGHNGNDVYVLFNYIDTLDIFGVIGSSENIPVDSVTAVDYKLIRKIDIHKGQTDWALGNMEWDIYNLEDTMMLGFHTMNACLSTKNNKIVENTSTIYPNPAKNIINFDYLNNIDEIEIVDALGTIITSVKVNTNKTSINVACFRPGLYIARLKSNNKVKAIKFIKK